MSDNTADLALLAEKIRTDCDLRTRSRSDWVAATIDLCAHLAEARAAFSDNISFGKWLDDADIRLGKTDRASAIAMGHDIDRARVTLEATESRSLQLIYEREFRLPIDRNTTAELFDITTGATPITQPRSRRTAKAGTSELNHEVRDYVRPLIEQDAPINVQEIVAATKRSRTVCEPAIAYERGRLAGIAEAMERTPATTDPEPETLPKTAQEKLAVAEKRLRAQLEAEFEQRVRDEVRRRLEARDEEDTLAIEQANALLAHTTGRLRPPFTAGEYHQLLWALHPDNRDPAKVVEAFIMVKRRKVVLCDDGPIKRRSSFAPLPKTLEELRAMRQKRQA
jgi:hypothetical protein